MSRTHCAYAATPPAIGRPDYGAKAAPCELSTDLCAQPLATCVGGRGLVRSQVEVIIAPAVYAAKDATRDIPIVMMSRPAREVAALPGEIWKHQNRGGPAIGQAEPPGLPRGTQRRRTTPFPIEAPHLGGPCKLNAIITNSRDRGTVLVWANFRLACCIHATLDSPSIPSIKSGWLHGA
jgi:hypothetical protein